MDQFMNQTRKQVNTGAGLLWSLIHLPEDFAANKTRYPVIVFMHGAGEIGSTAADTAKLCLYGTPHFAALGESFVYDLPQVGRQVKFITLAMQQPSVKYTTLDQILFVLDNDELLKGRTKEIFITGLSLGAQSIFESHWKQSAAKLSRVTGWAPYSGSWFTSIDNLLPKIAELKQPVALYWGTKEDKYVLYGSTQIPKVLNAANPGQVVTGSQPVGHCCWNPPYSNSFPFGSLANVYTVFALACKPEPYTVTFIDYTKKPPVVFVEGLPIVKDTVLNLEIVDVNYTIRK